MRFGNPNLPANPYRRPPTPGTMQGTVNNPQTYARQVNAGRGQLQPNEHGYGGGTNTNPYQRGNGGGNVIVNDPIVGIPTPVPGPVQETPWWQGNQVTTRNGVAYNPAALTGPRPVGEQRLGGITRYTSPSGLVGYTGVGQQGSLRMPAGMTFNGQGSIWDMFRRGY